MSDAAIRTLEPIAHRLDFLFEYDTGGDPSGWAVGFRHPDHSVYFELGMDVAEHLLERGLLASTVEGILTTMRRGDYD